MKRYKYTVDTMNPNSSINDIQNRINQAALIGLRLVAFVQNHYGVYMYIFEGEEQLNNTHVVTDYPSYIPPNIANSDKNTTS
jgi:uncharacterized protein YpiB (UPF0302 family)